jgi:hypothetical protein
MEQIKLWKIESDAVLKIKNQPLDFEHRLEKWLIKDISILSPDLRVIGSQIFTPQGKKIDMLAMNSLGELVIIELKRDKTYRDVVSQILDYATWIKDLDKDDLNNILNEYGNSEYKDIESFYSNTFEKDTEGIEFNSDHQMIIIGSNIDDSTVRIIKYLANEPYLVNINAINFNYFKDDSGQEFLAQAFIMPEESLTEGGGSKKRKRAKSIVSTLFELGKLKIGQKVYLKPALDQGFSKEKACATIVNYSQSCLKREGDDESHAFSGLRYILTDELGLKDVAKHWGFGVRNDWVDENGKTLLELLDD